MRGAGAPVRILGASVPSALSASASITIGNGSRAASACTTARIPAPVGIPGPSATACARAASDMQRGGRGLGDRIVAVGVARRHQLDRLGVERALPGGGRGDRGEASPAAQRRHPHQERRARLSRRARHDEEMPRAPLVGVGAPSGETRRDARRAEQPAARRRASVASLSSIGTPRSTSSIRPTGADGSTRSPSFRAPIVAVTSARKTTPAERPVSASSPDGMSTAIFRPAVAFIAAIAAAGTPLHFAAEPGAEDRVDDRGNARVDRPARAPQARAPVGLVGGVAAILDGDAAGCLERRQGDRRVALDLRPRRGEQDADGDARFARWRAATNPSPPFEPPPQTIATAPAARAELAADDGRRPLARPSPSAAASARRARAPPPDRPPASPPP